MNLDIEWGTIKFKANAKAVYREITSLGDEVKPQTIVDYARTHKKSELHKCFTWDNDEAAEKYRLYEARQISRNLVITQIKEDEETKIKNSPKIIRALFHTETTGGYRQTISIMKNDDEYQNLLRMAQRELDAFMAKFTAISSEDMREMLSAAMPLV